MSASLATVCQALLQSIGFNPTRHLLFPRLHWLCRLQQSNPSGGEAQGPCAANFDGRGVVRRTPLLFPSTHVCTSRAQGLTQLPWPTCRLQPLASSPILPMSSCRRGKRSELSRWLAS